MLTRNTKLLLGCITGQAAFLVAGYFLGMTWPFLLFGVTVFPIWWYYGGNWR